MSHGPEPNSNQLIHEKSPYLLQHAHNPVHWFAWGKEAFAKAEEEDKPVFLSIGYSTCHWCHVMERESFEDDVVAQILNASFVAIKVDREERPDIDHIYMTVCQALTGQGGWPLTVFLTPDKKPFYAGTYFPKEARYGRPGLLDILHRITEQWKTNRDTLEKAANRVLEHLQAHGTSNSRPLVRLGAEASATSAWKKLVQKGVEVLEGSFDESYGGFGEAPKFPSPHQLLFLLRFSKEHPESGAMRMVLTTLDGMAHGGIYDHVGGGFARYSTDRQWLVPHFEKMLYDNALLAMTYVEAGQATGESRYISLAEDILQYILRDMTSSEGGFFCAEDADSEGEEGKFYVWTPAQVIDVLGETDGRLWCRYYDIDEIGNFEGASIPNRIGQSESDFAVKEGLELDVLREKLRSMRRRLFEAREERVHPGKDDKVLTAWNGLAIAAFAKLGRATLLQSWVEASTRAAQMIKTHLVREDGRLLARYRAGEAKHLGYLDDYAFLIWGLIELYEATFDEAWLEWAVELQEQAIELFWDSQAGAFFMSGSDSEALIIRPKEYYDGATPSGNSAMAFNLLVLGKLTSSSRWIQLAHELLQVLADVAQAYPAGYAHALSAMQLAIGTSREVVVAGPWPSAATSSVLCQLGQRFLPETVVLLHAEDERGRAIERLVPDIANQRSINGGPTIYVCENFACTAPTNDVDAVLQTLIPAGREGTP